MYSDRRYLEECVRAGACGYLLKDCAYEDLAEALHAVSSDRPYVSSSIRAPRSD
jgi:DNA-binding NarL/FixJ family response regulator